jgi:hypothetical protein
VTGVAPDDLQASLLSEGRVVETVNVDELGNFIFSGLAPGSYDLVLSGPELEIHAQDLEVRSV